MKPAKELIGSLRRRAERYRTMSDATALEGRRILLRLIAGAYEQEAVRLAQGVAARSENERACGSVDVARGGPRSQPESREQDA
ncbi:hypothetical protein C7I55_27210 [Sphingomonas deserti]|uniref:Uncharacterized protein n=1 Tax=Allosphingosinicella deserti TaxID=2116704 RepID=A0A2P7QE60_9SPHN|nr:hypothetical protein C7I55_27210 [Sphingomonas deserti]